MGRDVQAVAGPTVRVVRSSGARHGPHARAPKGDETTGRANKGPTLKTGMVFAVEANGQRTGPAETNARRRVER